MSYQLADHNGFIIDVKRYATYAEAGQVLTAFTKHTANEIQRKTGCDSERAVSEARTRFKIVST